MKKLIGGFILAIFSMTSFAAEQRYQVVCNNILSDNGEEPVMHVKNTLLLSPLYYGHYILIERTSSGITQRLANSLDHCNFSEVNFEAKCFSYAESEGHLQVLLNRNSNGYVFTIGRGLNNPRIIVAETCKMELVEVEH